MRISDYNEFDVIANHIAMTYLGEELEKSNVGMCRNDSSYYLNIYTHKDIQYSIMYISTTNTLCVGLDSLKDMYFDDRLLILQSYIYEEVLGGYKDEEALYNDYYSMALEDYNLYNLLRFYEHVAVPLRAVRDAITHMRYSVADTSFQTYIDSKLVGMLNKPIL